MGVMKGVSNRVGIHGVQHEARFRQFPDLLKDQFSPVRCSGRTFPSDCHDAMAGEARRLAARTRESTE